MRILWLLRGSAPDVFRSSAADCVRRRTSGIFRIQDPELHTVFSVLLKWYLRLRYRYQLHRIQHKSAHPVLLQERNAVQLSLTKISFLESLSFISSQVIPIFSNSSSVFFASRPFPVQMSDISFFFLLRFHCLYVSVRCKINNLFPVHCVSHRCCRKKADNLLSSHQSCLSSVPADLNGCFDRLITDETVIENQRRSFFDRNRNLLSGKCI